MQRQGVSSRSHWPSEPDSLWPCLPVQMIPSVPTVMSVRSATTSCLLAATAVGVSIAVTPMIADFPVYAGQAGRYALAALVLTLALPVLDPGRAGTRPELRQLARLGIAAATGSAGFNILLVLATRHADPAAIGAVVGGSPVVLAVLGAPRGSRRPQRGVLLGALLATAGVMILQGTGHSSPTGLLLATGVLACEVAFTLVAAPLLPAFGPVRVSVWSCAIAAALLTCAALLSPVPPRLPTGVEAATLAYQGLVMTAVAFVLWYRGVARLGSDRAGVTMAAAPVAAAVVAAAAGTGRLTLATALGAGAVALGIGLATYRRRVTSGPRQASAAEGCRTGSPR